MKRNLLALACTAALAACSQTETPKQAVAAPAPAATPAPAPAAPAPKSGVDLQFVDAATRAQDDFYRHVNGKWLDTTQIPADKSAYGTGTIVFDRIQDNLHGLVDDAAAGKAGAGNADTRKIGDLYASFMDEAALETLDAKPLAAQFEPSPPSRPSRWSGPGRCWR